MPFLTRTRKRWTAVAAVALLAFAHAAIAASGCLTSAMPVSETGCEEHQQASPNELVCRTHLQAESQTLDLAKLPEVFHLTAPVLVLAPERAYVAFKAGLAFHAPLAFAGAPPPLNVLYSRSLT